MNDTEIKFGPRPEKLWVGMKAINRDGTLVELVEYNSMGIGFTCHWSNGIDTTPHGVAPLGTEIVYNISQWEQPTATYCDPESEPEPDWKAKYECVLEKLDDVERMYERLQAEMKAQECAYNVVVRDKSLVEKQRDMALRERNIALSKIYAMQEKAKKLDKIEEVLRGEYEEDD